MTRGAHGIVVSTPWPRPPAGLVRTVLPVGSVFGADPGAQLGKPPR